MIFNKDQAQKLRMLAEEEGLKKKEDPMTYSSLLGEESRQPEHNFIMILAVAFIAAFLVIVGVVIFTQNNQKYEETIKSLGKQGRTLKEEIAMLTAKTEKLESALTDNSSRSSQLMGQLGQMGTLNDELKFKLAALDKERAGLLNQVLVTQEKMRTLEVSKKNMEDKLLGDVSALKSRMGELDGRVEKALSVPQKSAPAFDGEIALIDTKNNFVLVNLGRDKGLEKGMMLEVLSGSAVVGELQVVEARQEASACDIKTDQGYLHLGDKVRIKK